MSNQTQTTQTTEQDEGIFVPEQRFPIIIHFGGDKKLFDARVNDGRNEKDPELKKKLANAAKHDPRVTGFWFISKENYEKGGGDANVVPDGWQGFTTTIGEKDVEGFATNNIKIAVCRMRRVREIKRAFKDSGEPKRWGWFTAMPQLYKDKKMYQKRLQILGIVSGMEGLNDGNGVVVTMKTNAVDQMFGNRRDNKAGIFNPIDTGEGADSYFYKYVLGPAAKAAGVKGIAQNYYWLELTHARDVKGFPAWEKIEYGEGANDYIYVCPVTWAQQQAALERKLDWKSLAVIQEYRDLGDAIRKNNSEWSAAWSDKNVKLLNETIVNNETADEDGVSEITYPANSGNGNSASHQVARAMVAPPPPPDEEVDWDSMPSAAQAVGEDEWA